MSTADVEETISFLLACGDDDELVLPGVGQLGTRHHKSYLGRNPRTGEPIPVPATALPFFRVDPTLLRALNRDEVANDEVDAAIKAVRTRFADALGERIHAKLLSGETVMIDELGTFAVVEKPGRPGWNPLTGEAITIPPRRTVRFTAAESLKTRLRDSTSA
jgi:nucleoid DNA-binding protein